ncbi:hypothetical protein JMA_32610 [Jeotgalibacillus malaysiensis]|uniref:Uncharacterized protein n=1 Tax=Jeotgalibacillus malaysiensis TaxID=1508404 RepID=A0A0B5AVF8_9BACL|nr:hypothetical protein [Jeotgalibacillus malaysiensis]AJD92578.1 hypothetical protein JMA_32610 [Jeotgalibacillus malaysiensis]
MLTVYDQQGGGQSLIVYIESLVEQGRLEEIIEWSGEMKWLTDDHIMSSKIQLYQNGVSFQQLTKKLLDGEAFVLKIEQKVWKIKGIAVPKELS